MADAEALCAALEEAACRADRACASMYSALYDPVRKCVGPSASFLGCTQNKPCNAAVGHFRDPQGRIWQSGTSSLDCHPKGWRPLDIESIAPGASSLEHCPTQL
jgi:hypothetical protein